MAYRFTNTEKWNDAWFLDLKPIEKLLFLYLCDNCDAAGFIEFIPRKFAFEIGETEAKILGALKGLDRGLIYSKSNDCIFLRNFLKHQKNLPLRENNNAHIGILKRFEVYKTKFEIDNIEEFINQEVKPLSGGYGKGNGNGKGNSKECNFFDFKNALKLEGVTDEILNAYLLVRKRKRLVDTEIAFNGLMREIKKTDKTPNEIITLCVEKSWGGFESKWLNNNTNNNGNQRNESGFNADDEWRKQMEASIARDYANLSR